MRRLSCLLVGFALWLLTPPGLAHALSGQPPIDGPVVHRFDPPALSWQRGHRGVDLAGTLGEPVHASANGVVTFAATLAGRGVVVVSHGALRTTYEPVSAAVRVGQRVSAGDLLGFLQGGHADCPASACLHWGLKRGDEYLDPLSLAGGEVLLLPADAVASAERAAKARRLAGTGTGRLLRPVPGGIGSPFGMRRHPIFHDWRLHAGVDLHAACGTPIRAAADGVVVSVSYDASGGHRLVLAHDGGLTTHYLHAQGYQVRRGQRVTRGEVVGRVGSTGWSTGCHLHLTVKNNGRLVDPAPLLGG